MNRKDFLRTSSFLILGGAAALKVSAKDTPSLHHSTAPLAKESKEGQYPMYDLHVHTSQSQSIEDIVRKSREMGLSFGVMQNVAPWGIKTNEDLQAYLDEMSKYPVYIGLQPMSLGWSKNLSPELIAKADYVAMDPQVVPKANGYGEQIEVYTYASYIDSAETFMQANMDYYMKILSKEEPIDIFACPLLLPNAIEREYHTLWTKERQEMIIEACRKNVIAIEINDLMHVPHKEFILKAKKAGVKFTFGSDTRNQQTGRLIYCHTIAKECGLEMKDFFIPKRKLG